MLRTLSRPLVAGVERYLPGAFVFAVVLTVIVAVLALIFGDIGPAELTRAWGDGLAGLLAFMTQVALVLLLGYTLALTRPVKAGLLRIADVPKSPRAAYAFVAFVSAVASLISFGLGLVVGGVIALEVGRAARRRGTQLHYPLLVASAYSGFAVWHMGYSATGPLAAATPGSFVEEAIGRTIPISETVYSPWNLIAIVIAVAAIIGTVVLMAPKGTDRVIELPERMGEEEPDVALKDPETPAERMEASRVVTLIPGLALLGYLGVYLAQEGFDLTLDIVNWSFLAAILLIVRSPAELAELVGGAVRTVGEVLLQYPLYAGIIGMMTASGLAAQLSGWFTDIASPGTLGLFAFLSAGLLNLFVPSGGGQFAVQAPIFLDAADSLGVDPAVITMAIAYGDQWTNMIQPFWALPLLAVAGLGVRDIFGFTAITCLITGIVFGGTMLVLGGG
ncbi:short-chain fatty acid transporter [Blastococcus tunisiensis]|uniref:Short-chain fatty acids transporter n=1 Tax=Blastococcus tunisiensis TaxID=1798228 RepID=A0A1I1WEM5_9ACTN|nr:TIGR00366 family protein [Blastococcus sp. DSM 46838]SFD91853.1 short-chain fatty acids transporter [Blastococcus sp. DSM 46838]